MTVAAAIPDHLTRLNIVREFEAPRALLWKMWTDPAHVGVWFAPEHFTTPWSGWTCGPAEPCTWLSAGAGRERHPFDGRFIELDKPERLVMRTWIKLPDGSTWFEVEHTARFEEIDGRTILRFQAVVVEAREDAIGPLSGMEMGWSQSLDKLAAHVRAVTAAGG